MFIVQGKMIAVGSDSVTLKIVQIEKDYCIAECQDDKENFIREGTEVIKKLHSKPRDWIGVWSRKVIF